MNEPHAAPDPDEVDEEEVEAERKERLDPDNRPDHAEVDNTGREFDSEAGMFTDNPEYDEVDHDHPPYDDEAGEMQAPNESGEVSVDGDGDGDGADAKGAEDGAAEDTDR